MKTGRPPKNERSTFGSRIYELRERSGLSQQEVAEQLGISQSGYALWERRRASVKPENLVKLAAIFRVRVEALLLDDDLKNRKEEPSGRSRKLFAQVSKLPRQKQKKILDVVEDWLIPQTPR